MVKSLTLLLLAQALWLTPVGVDAQPARTDLAPLDATNATLVVQSAPDIAGVSMDLDAIEALDTYQMTTTTPWRDGPAVFEGVLLRDLLGAHGIADAPMILVRAENDFQSRIPRAVWAETDIMVATRVNGGRISRRERGPILFVVDATTYASSDLLSENHLVWMASVIMPMQED